MSRLSSWSNRWLRWLAGAGPSWSLWQMRSDAPASRSQLGIHGEAIAARFLERQGMRIVTQRFRNRFGEIDLVATHDRVVVFVEVKTWRRPCDGRLDEHPADAVDSVKQQRLTRAALAFLKQFRLLECAVRFDVVTVTWTTEAEVPQIRHFVHAFEPGRFGQFFG